MALPSSRAASGVVLVCIRYVPTEALRRMRSRNHSHARPPRQDVGEHEDWLKGALEEGGGWEPIK